MPGSESVGIGTYYMTNKICAYTRSILESGIEDGFNYLDVLLSSETCQMMHRGYEHSEILNPVKENNPRVFMRMTDVPFTVGGAAAEHYEDQIKTRILEPLNKTCGVGISEDAIKAAIEDYNGISEIISEIGDMCELPEPPISGYEFHVIQLVSEVCSHYLIKDKLRETLR